VTELNNTKYFPNTIFTVLQIHLKIVIHSKLGIYSQQYRSLPRRDYI